MPRLKQEPIFRPSAARRPRTGRFARRAGLSLLEVLTALAIFFLSIVVISQMVDQASRTAQKAARLTKAALLAENVMSELSAGVRQLASSGQEAVQDSEAGWLVSVQAQPESWAQLQDGTGTGYGLHLVHVQVVWQNAAGYPETEHTLSRVIMDPALRQSPSFGTISAAAASGASSSAGSGSTGTGGSDGAGSGGSGTGGSGAGGSGAGGSGAGGTGRSGTGGAGTGGSGSGGGGRTGGGGGVR